MISRYALSLLVAFAATHLNAAFADSPHSFEADILPILNAHCLQCHGGVHQKNDLDLRTLAALLKGGKSGAAIVAGNSEESLLWQKIVKDEMPKTDNKVSEANKKRIRAWIEDGARGKAKARELDLTRPALKAAEVAKCIDREIDAKLKDAKIPASARASDAEFLRRVFLDITGKPPSAEVTSAFLASADAAKRSQCIDKLLASEDFGKHFAERWVNLFRQMSVNQSEWDPEQFQSWFAERFNKGQGWDATRYLSAGFGRLLWKSVAHASRVRRIVRRRRARTRRGRFVSPAAGRLADGQRESPVRARFGESAPTDGRQQNSGSTVPG